MRMIQQARNVWGNAKDHESCGMTEESYCIREDMVSIMIRRGTRGEEPERKDKPRRISKIDLTKGVTEVLMGEMWEASGGFEWQCKVGKGILRRCVGRRRKRDSDM